jgi:hypothetical protein
MCSYKLIATPIAYPRELHFEQGVHHYDLQCFVYNMNDMYNLTPKIQEVMTSTMWLTDKQIQQKRALESGLYSHLWTLETIVSPAPKFMKICKLAYHDIRNNLSFGSGD